MAIPVKYIPEGYQTVTPDLVVKDVPQAIEFYKKAFSAQEIMRLTGPDDTIVHAEIKIGDSRVMLCAECPERGCFAPVSLKGSSSMLYVYVEDVDAAYEQAVRAGAESLMKVEDMFWGDRVGELRDPSGHRWSLATHKKDLTPEEITQGSEAFFAAASKTT